MGQYYTILLALFLVPVTFTIVLRANAAQIFMSMCAGYVLAQFLSNDAKIFTDGFLPQAGLGVNSVKIGLITAPTLLTLLFKISSVKGRRAILNLLPALAVGCLSVILIVPLLPGAFAVVLRSIPWWSQVVRIQDLLVGLSTLICLMFVWTQRAHHIKEVSEKKRT